MNDAIRCPGCDAALMLPVLPEGQSVACPRCRRVFEPARQRPSITAPPAQRSETSTPREVVYDDPDPIPAQRTRPKPPRGTVRGYLAISLIALSGIAIAVHVCFVVGLILLIQAQENLGGPRDHPNAAFLGERPPRPNNPQQVRLNERWVQWERFWPAEAILCFLLFWPALLSLMIWLHRVHANLPGLNASGLSYVPAWAVMAFLVPIFNLIMPFAFIQEVWRASHPSAVETGVAWRNTPFARSVRIWWMLCAAAGVLGIIAIATGPAFPRTYDELWWSAWFGVGAGLCYCGACGVLIYIIRKITQRQQERYDRL